MKAEFEKDNYYLFKPSLVACCFSLGRVKSLQNQSNGPFQKVTQVQTLVRIFTLKTVGAYIKQTCL